MATTGRRVEIVTPDGAMPGYVVEPEGAEPRSAVLVLMEAFGLVPHMERVAERIAGLGYVALAPDLYYRQGPDARASYDELPKAIELMGRLDDEEFVADMGAALGFLHALPSVGDAKVGVTGFCMGGRLSFLLASALPDEIAASAPFYGGGFAALLDRADRIRCPLRLFFGGEDAFIPQEQVREIDAKLGALGLAYRIDNYAGAQHGFCCDERPEHDQAAAKDAWVKLEAFFARHL
jgi:carboxymethylenebutenolidase